MNNKELAIKLAMAETEEEVITILKDEGYWDNYKYWASFGDNDNNYAIIGNQQSEADAALVEKLVNSVDAILMKECMCRKIDMAGNNAPSSTNEAMKTFFKIPDGKLYNLDSKTRNKLAQNIILAATCPKNKTSHLNLVIADRGEGQTPNKMPDTLLSIGKSNKMKVPFVQGKFNMGGTGVLPFCGEHHLELIISKRCQELEAEGDDSFGKWSVTVVRRENARNNRRSSMYTYLTTGERNSSDKKHKSLLQFEADQLEIIPTTANQSFKREAMSYGTFIKLFDYRLKKNYKSNILMDLNYRLALLLPGLAHPIQLRECRPYYKGHTFSSTLNGLETRLQDEKRKKIVEGFPYSDTFSIDGQSFSVLTYLFNKQVKNEQNDDGKDVKKEKKVSENYREKAGVLFIQNGQTQMILPDRIFGNQDVHLPILKDYLLVMVNCTELDTTHHEDLFMNSRDRLRQNEFSQKVQDQIKKILKNSPILKKIQNDWRNDMIENRLGNDKPMQEMLQKILQKSPVLSRILVTGMTLQNPFNITNNAGENEVFQGKRHPTFFKIRSKKMRINGLVRNH